MKNTLTGLRDTLFDTLNRLKSNDKEMDLDRAKTIVNVSGAIIDTAKVELQFLNQVGSDRLPPVVDPEDAVHFLAQENDTRTNPHVNGKKGLETGKFLGTRQ